MAVYDIPRVKTWQDIQNDISMTGSLPEFKVRANRVNPSTLKSFDQIASVFGQPKIQSPDLYGSAKKASSYGDNIMAGLDKRNDAVLKARADMPKKGMSTTTAANIATGINTLANVGVGIYGAIQASKTKPMLASYKALEEPTLVPNRSSSIYAAGKEGIDKAINTSRNQQARLGIADSSLVGKETEAMNQLSGQLSQYMTSIDAQNAGIENQFKAQRHQSEQQRGQFNAQTENQFNIYKNQVMSNAMSGISTNVTSGIQSIINNMNYKDVKDSAEIDKANQGKLDTYIRLKTSGDPQSMATATKMEAELRKLGLI